MPIKKFTTIESLWSLGNLIRENWFTLTALLTGGAGMTYLTVATEWLNEIGPIAWGVAFFIGAYAALGIVILRQNIVSRQFLNRQAEIAYTKHGVNPRERRFEKQCVSLQDFFSVYYHPHLRKEFVDCDIVGPALVLFVGCNLVGLHFKSCQIVIARDNVPITGASKFETCSFVGGTMSNVTMIMTAEHYRLLPEEIRANVPVLHRIVD
jgi:hypothetical protein